MKKVFYIVAVLALGFFAQSCGLAAFGPSSPAFIADVRSTPVAVTSNSLGKNAKVGESKQVNVLGLVAAGDASIEKAAKAAGITKITHVDQKNIGVLGLFVKTKTIVYGD